MTALAIGMILYVLLRVCAEVVQGMLAPTCTVGVPGTGAQVSFQGISAVDMCKKLVSSGTFSAVPEPGEEPAICGEQGLFMRYTVYADGVFDREGETLCQTISELLASGCPLDKPEVTQRAILPEEQDEDLSQRRYCDT